MTLKKVDSLYGSWEMQTDNASIRAYQSLGIQYFDNLEQIEHKYKSWKGITLLAQSKQQLTPIH